MADQLNLIDNYFYTLMIIKMKTGIPLIKALVPSIGSIIHVNSEFLLIFPSSSPIILWSGNLACINFLTIFSIFKSKLVTT